MKYPTYKELPKEISKRDLARLLEVAPTTVDSWVRQGKLAPGRRVLPAVIFSREAVAKALRLKPARK